MGQPFLQLSDPQVARVEEITAKHQINRGGSVILVQLENEHSRGWGTDVGDPYLKYLDDQARAHGIEVPMFNSGLHHSQDPSGEIPFPPDPAPWYSTEFWTGWIGKYGEMTPGTIDEKVRGTWKIIAFGGAGYNYYMAHGGSNFGYSGDSFAASYDYSAPIGEAGQLHQFYFPARRAACFAQAFTPLLTGSHDDPGLAKSDQPALRVTTRTNPTGGSIVFVDHFQRKAGAAPIAALPPDAGAGAYHPPKADPTVVLSAHLTVGNLTLPHQGALKVAVSEPRTVILNLPWTHNAFFESICTNILSRQTLGSVDYFVCYGPAGDNGEVTLHYKTPGKSPSQIDFTYPADDSFHEIDLDSGDGREAKLLVMNTGMTNHTWFAHDRIYIGPSFVLENGSLQFPLTGGSATIFSAAGKSAIAQPAVPDPALPVLADWSWRDAAAERMPSFNAKNWLSSTGPQPMETYDSYSNRYGWYRTTLHRDAAGPVSLHFGNQSGLLTAYLNGQPSASANLQYNESGKLIVSHVPAGDNTLAILVKASPRSKNVSGLIGARNARGIWGGISHDQAPTPLPVVWKHWDKAPRDANADDLAKPDYDDSAWSAVSETQLKAPRGNSWYRGTFTIGPDQVDSILETPSFGPPEAVKPARTPPPAKVAVYVNGHLLVEKTGDVSRFLLPGKNIALVEIQSRLGEDSGALALSLWHNSPLAKAPWYFHGGLDNLEETAVIGRVTNWDDFLGRQPWQASAASVPDQPSFWKCHFTYHSPPGSVQTLGLVTDGLKAGHVWLNGHNLGECPQAVLMYVPECWLKEGGNDLVIFDLYGKKPGQVKMARYEAFSVANAK